MQHGTEAIKEVKSNISSTIDKSLSGKTKKKLKNENSGGEVKFVNNG